MNINIIIKYQLLYTINIVERMGIILIDGISLAIIIAAIINGNGV